MHNIWDSLSKDKRHYWNKKTETLRFWRYVSERRKFLVYDTETTGIRKNADVIVEFSAIVMEVVNGIYQMTDFIEIFIKPPFQMTEDVIAVHGITNEFLEDKPTEDEAWPALVQFITKHSDAVLSGYNISFDNKFMEQMAKRHHSVFAPKEMLDFFDLVKENVFFDEHGGERKLSQITTLLFPAKQYNYHDASEDILATWDVGTELLRRFVESNPKPESTKQKGQILSYEYKKFGKPQYIFLKVKTGEYVHSFYYDIYASCWVNKSEKYNCFDFIDMDDIEAQMTKIAESKGKAKFRLLRDSESYNVD